MIGNFISKNVSFILFILFVSLNLTSLNRNIFDENFLVESLNLDVTTEEQFFKSSFKNSNDSSVYTSIDPPEIENSIFFVSEETGIIKEEFFLNDNITVSNHEDNSIFSIIETNLTSLQYDKKATGEDKSNNNFWVRSSEGLLGPKRLEGNLELDYTDVFEGKASTRFSVTTNTSLNWYSDYQLPGWIDDKIPSIFSHNSYIKGAFQFNATQNLLDHQYGFNNWLRLIFDNSNYVINVIFNRSNGLIENTSSFYRNVNQDFIINIVLDSNDANHNVLAWKEGKWTRFNINLTGILNTIYPLNSLLRLEAEKAFSNLSLSFLDLQSFAFENGFAEFRLDDFHWITTISDTEKIAWEQNNKAFVDTQGNQLENISKYGLDDFSWLKESSQWKILFTDNTLIIKSPTSFSPFLPVWEFKKESFYYYNKSWTNKIGPKAFFHLDLTYKIDSAGVFMSSDNSSFNFISPPFLIMNFLKYPTFAELSNIDMIFTFFRFNQFNESKTFEIMKESRYWIENSNNEEESLENLKNSLINSSLLPYNKNKPTSSYSWELNKQEIISDNELFVDFTNSLFTETVLNDFPQIKESIILPNLFYEVQIPIKKVFENGIQFELVISSEDSLNSFTFFSEIVTVNFKSILSHSIVLNEKTVIFIPWIETPNQTDKIIIKLYLLIQNIGIGWIEEEFLMNIQSNSSVIPLTTKTIESSKENDQLTNTSNNFNYSNNKNSIANHPNNILNSESSNIAFYGLMIIGPILGSLFYYKRKQRNKIYEMIYDE